MRVKEREIQKRERNNEKKKRNQEKKKRTKERRKKEEKKILKAIYTLSDSRFFSSQIVFIFHPYSLSLFFSSNSTCVFFSIDKFP